MKKLIIFGVVAVIALASLSVGYAMWSKTLTVDGTVATGSLDVVWLTPTASDADDVQLPPICPTDDPDCKNVSDIDCEIDLVDSTILNIDITDAYPSIDYFCAIGVKSLGTVPVHTVVDLLAETLPPGTTYTLLADADPQTKNIVDLPQLHVNDMAYGILKFHFFNVDPLIPGSGAAQNADYTFSAELLFHQWNETP